MPESAAEEVVLRVRKKAECPACGCVYSSGKVHVVRGRGATANSAREHALLVARLKLRMGFRGPCPGCGRLPPAEERRARRTRQWLTIAPSIAIFYGLILFVKDRKPFSTDEWAGLVALASGIFALLHLVVALRAGKRNRIDERARAHEAIATGAVVIDRPGASITADDDSRTRRKRLFVGCAVVCVAPGLAVSAPLYRIINGWDLDPRLNPGVVGPGDLVQVGFDQQIEAVDERWRGTARAVVQYQTGGQLVRFEVPARSESMSWDPNSINVHSRRYRTSPRLWAEVTIPRDAPSGGRLRVEIGMIVIYPMPVEDYRFTDTELHAHQEVEIDLVRPGAGPTYTRLFWGGLLGSMLMVVGLGLGYAELLPRAARRKATVILDVVPP